MKVMVLSSFTTSLFWFRIDMMRSFLDAGCEVVAVGDDPEGEWAPKFRELGIRYRQIYPMIAVWAPHSCERVLRERCCALFW